MGQVSSRHFCLSVEILMLLFFAGPLMLAQAVTSQAPSLQSQSSAPASAQSSGQPSANQTPADQPATNISPSEQSLGDIARTNQQKKAQASPPRKITNADIPRNPDGYAGPPADDDGDSAPPAKNNATSQQAIRQQNAEKRAAAQWRQRILAQENVVANLQARVDQLRARINLFDPNAYSDSNRGGEYNGGQTRFVERFHQLEDQLNQQKQRLEAMQESARHAGMHTTAYDP
jgi:hypothetical protein